MYDRKTDSFTCLLLFGTTFENCRCESYFNFCKLCFRATLLQIVILDCFVNFANCCSKTIVCKKNSSTKHDMARSYFQLWLKSATRVTKSREKLDFFWKIMYYNFQSKKQIMTARGVYIKPYLLQLSKYNIF